MILIVIMYALFAAEFPIAKLVLDYYTNPFFLETVRMLIGGVLFLFYYIAVRGKKCTLIETKDWKIFAQLIIFYMYLSYFSAGWALQYMSSLKANMFSSLMPFVSAVLSYIILRDKPTVIRMAGMIIGAIGFMVIVAGSAEREVLVLGEFMRISLPELMMLVSIISTEYGYFLLKQLYDKGYSLVFINGIAMLVGGALSISSGFLFFEKELFTYTALLPVFAYAFLLFLMINVIDNALYGILIRRYSITFLTFASFLTPLFGVIYGIMFMGEHISWTHVFAFGFIFLGLYLFYRDELKTRRQSPPPGPEQISL